MLTPDSITAIILFFVGGVFVVLWWLLRMKDSAQAGQIALLFEKHDEDVKRLSDLELKIAERHYQKTELDGKFERLESSFRTGIDQLGTKFDRLAETLLSREAR
jgi:biopolymer transport protein ExbB/TolQ